MPMLYYIAFKFVNYVFLLAVCVKVEVRDALAINIASIVIKTVYLAINYHCPLIILALEILLEKF